MPTRAEDPRHDVHGQEVHGVHQQHPDEDREGRGRDEVALAVEDALHLIVDEARRASSTKAWRLVGTPAVAPRTTHHSRPMPTMPRIAAVTTESTCRVQKEPSTDRLREEGQVVLDVFGGGQFAAVGSSLVHTLLIHALRPTSRTNTAIENTRIATANVPTKAIGTTFL